jgi:hypothetical protein
MTDSVYTLTAEHVAELNDETAIKAFQKLLLAETWRLRIPQRHVRVSSAINVADGGIDARGAKGRGGKGGGSKGTLLFTAGAWRI